MLSKRIKWDWPTLHALLSCSCCVSYNAARSSLRITKFISPCIIGVICLLILFSYTMTSLASTSLQLLRPLTFTDIKDVRTFLSPEIKGHHLIYYAKISLICEILVIGFPLLLSFEPLIRKTVTLIRIRPLLDQFHGCFKDKHHWFAAYYLIC